MSRVRSAEGSARYFAEDNFCSPEAAAPLGQWLGAGATYSCLCGQPTPSELEALLSGRMTDGSMIRAGSDKTHALGSDFVFSAPKSVSLLAYVGGDQRLLTANRHAVMATMTWAERHLAARRQRVGAALSIVPTGNLLMALFEHDTSRELDPHAHVHVIIMNATRTAGGGWRALHNRALWRANPTLGEMHSRMLMTHAHRLGYRTLPSGRHGSFEIADVPRGVIEAFSIRRSQVLVRASKLDHATPRSIDSAQRTSRRRKATAIDREGMLASWRSRAYAIGFDLCGVVECAASRAQEGVPRGNGDAEFLREMRACGRAAER